LHTENPAQLVPVASVIGVPLLQHPYTEVVVPLAPAHVMEGVVGVGDGVAQLSVHDVLHEVPFGHFPYMHSTKAAQLVPEASVIAVPFAQQPYADTSFPLKPLHVYFPDIGRELHGSEREVRHVFVPGHFPYEHPATPTQLVPDASVIADPSAQHPNAE
jgi:hypothetical protein